MEFHIVEQWSFQSALAARGISLWHSIGGLKWQLEENRNHH